MASQPHAVSSWLASPCTARPKSRLAATAPLVAQSTLVLPLVLPRKVVPKARATYVPVGSTEMPRAPAYVSSPPPTAQSGVRSGRLPLVDGSYAGYRNTRGEGSP